jgi:hypothetical protein
MIAAAAAAVSLVALGERVAHANPGDAAAKKLRDQAIYTDYLATNFAGAEGKLTQAIASCGDGDACSAPVRARLQCDLGSVLFGDSKVDEAKAHFQLAIKEDPNVALERDLSSPDMKRLYDAVKSGGATTPGGGAAAGAAPPPPSGPAATEDLTHAPPAEQVMLTPIPIYVEIPEGVDAARVIVRYSATGLLEWKTAVLHQVGKGWGGEIPCTDVGDSLGDLKYFVQATDANGDLVGWSGRLVKPHVVHVVDKLSGEAPHLPGQGAPIKCTQKTDCPPGFPGCHSEGAKTACETDAECTSAQVCKDGYCEGNGQPAPEEDQPYSKNWLSIGFQADLLMLPSAENACSGGTGYTCFDSGGGYYGSIPLKGADDSINGGPALSTMRILVGYDRALLPNITAGARLGYAFNGGPQRPNASAFDPLHVEVRGAYWFGHNPLARSGFRFFALLAGGIAEVDGSIAVDVYANPQAYQAGKSQNFVAWKKTGTGFAAVGGGAMYALTPKSGVLLEAKVMELFPTAAPAAGLQLAYAMGL